MTTTIRLSQGIRRSTNNGASFSRGLAHRIEQRVLHERAPDLLRQAAEERRRQVAAIARGMYARAVEQAIEASIDSGVPVDAPQSPPRDGRTRTDARVGSGRDRRYRRLFERPRVMVTIVRRFRPFENSRAPSLEDAAFAPAAFHREFGRSLREGLRPRDVQVAARLDTEWPTLHPGYARQPIRSRIFHRKQSIAAPALKVLLNELRPRLRRPSGYQKGGLAYVLESARGGRGPTLTTAFVINYPGLGRWDFLRRAFLSGYPVKLPVAGRLQGAERVIGADAYRPLMVPLARQFGQKYRALLRSLR